MRSLKWGKSGGARKNKKTYYLHEMMQFILPFVTVHPTTAETPGNIPSPPPPADGDKNDCDNSHEVNQCKKLKLNRQYQEAKLIIILNLSLHLHDRTFSHLQLQLGKLPIVLKVMVK